MKQPEHRIGEAETEPERKPSILRRLCDLMSTSGEGWEIHPISSKVFVFLRGSETFLSDGDRFVPYPSFADDLERLAGRVLFRGSS